MALPSLFIGSSSEGLHIANLVKEVLTDVAEITLWNEDFFDLSSTFIETLDNNLNGFDFALLIFTPDDMTNSRKSENFGPRDNVIFEAGLFMGRLGRARTFLMTQYDGVVKIPTDLSGVNTAIYQLKNERGQNKISVNAGCESIKKAIQRLGISDENASKKIKVIQSKQELQQTTLLKQQSEIRLLQFALQGIVTQYEYDKLVGLNKVGPFMCKYSGDLITELKRLRAMRLVANFENLGLRTISELYGPNQNYFDLKHYFKITTEGTEYLQMRHSLEAEGG